MGSPSVVEMTWQERMIYRIMLQKCYHFRNLGLPAPTGYDGSFSSVSVLSQSDFSSLSCVLGVPKRFLVPHLPKLLLLFDVVDGRLFHRRVSKDLELSYKRRNRKKPEYEKNALGEGKVPPTLSLSLALDGIKPTSLPKSSVGGGPSDQQGRVAFKNFRWGKEEDAIAEALRVCQEIGKIGVYHARLVVRNALDCWGRRKGRKPLKAPRSVFLKRCRKGREILKRSGAKHDDRSADIVAGWLRDGKLRP